MELIKKCKKYDFLLKELISRELKLKYRRSFLGYIWSILNPLLVMFIMVLVFSQIFEKSIPNFPVYLFTGKVLFDFVLESTNRALGSITGNGALITKTMVPKEIFVVAETASSFITSLFSTLALIIVMIITKVTFSLSLFFVPIIYIQVFIFTLGISFFLAQFNVFFRDIKYIYRAITTAWSYLTPIFYPIEALSFGLMIFVKKFNPMYSYITQFRTVVLEDSLPDVRLVIYGFIVSMVILVTGYFFFKKNENKFILYI